MESIKSNHSDFWTGVEQSTESLQVFSTLSTKNGIFVQRIIIFATYVIISTLIVPFLAPIGNAIFGFPQPHLWFFPFQIAWVHYVGIAFRFFFAFQWLKFLFHIFSSIKILRNNNGEKKPLNMLMTVYGGIQHMRSVIMSHFYRKSVELWLIWCPLQLW